DADSIIVEQFTDQDDVTDPSAQALAVSLDDLDTPPTGTVGGAPSGRAALAFDAVAVPAAAGTPAGKRAGGAARHDLDQDTLPFDRVPARAETDAATLNDPATEVAAGDHTAILAALAADAPSLP